MFEFTDNRPEIAVQETEYKRLLGFPVSYELTGRSRELADWAARWYERNGKPWLYIRQAEALIISNGTVIIDGEVITSPRLHGQLMEAHADEAMLVAVSAGKELEEEARRLWMGEKPDEYFFLEIYGSAVVEHLTTVAAYRLCEWADRNRKSVLPHYSPGYPGWAVSDQKRLLRTIRQGDKQTLPGELDVYETGMLTPKKSLLALYGITSCVGKAHRLTELTPCEKCSLSPCQYRRAPYTHEPLQIEDVLRLQPRSDSSVDRSAEISARHQYTFNIATLRKWARNRLQFRTDADHSIAARFRYEGTTCSNLGRPLEFDYHLRLGPKSDGHRILEARCEPAPGDTGHKSMCKYIENAEELMRGIKDEQPLLGRNLNDIFDWKRPYDPSGCYCDPLSRNHKWGLVLEVLHVALSHVDGEPD
ncbi:MAG: hypothetical protein FJ215_10405 [Ignavibacteria bacterium]|nr:hypothetical protein [Ignavibacteria bacterium]